MELGKLFVQLPHGRVARLRSHLTTLGRTFQMERPIIFRIHRPSPALDGQIRDRPDAPRYPARQAILIA